MTSFTVSRAASIVELRPEWEALEERTAPRLPFSSPLWTELWWRHFAERNRLVHDSLELLAVRDSRGSLRGVAPMVLTRRPALPLIGIRTLRPLGADPGVTELLGAVCAPEDELAVNDALLDYLDETRARWDIATMVGFRKDGVFARRLEARAGASFGRELPDFVLPLPESWEVFKAGLKRNIKESLRKCFNAPKRDGLEPRLKVSGTAEEAGPAIERFFALHSARASLGGTVAHRDVFASEPPRSFLRAYAQEMAKRDKLRVFELELAGRVVATRVGLIAGDSLYLYYSGFDPEYGRYSVMTTVVAEAIRWAIEQRFKTVNLSVGSDVSKTRWGPEELLFTEATFPSRSLRGPVVQGALGWLSQNEALRAALAFARRRSHRS